MKKLRNLLAVGLVLFGVAGNLFAQEIKRIDEDFETLYKLCSKEKPDMAAVKKLLKSGVTINNASEKSYTPLTYSLYNKNTELAKLLIEYGADVNLKDSNERHPMILACVTGDLNLVKLMVSKGADVNCTNKNKYTPLIYAVEYGSKKNIELVKFLVEKGADVNAASDDGWTPLILAGWEDTYLDLMKYLVSKNADINAKNESGTNVGKTCARQLDIECYKFLEKNGFDFKVCDEDGNTVLHNFTKLVTVDDSDGIFFHQLIKDREKEIAEIITFLAKKIDVNAVNKSKETALHLACKSLIDYPKIVEILIKNGADVNALDKYNRNPIFSCGNTPKIVQLLIDSGADLSIKDHWGRTNLDLYEKALKNDPKLAEVVEIIKANSKVKKEYSFVQLCEYNYADKALEMLKKGKVKGLDDYDSEGYTPLYYAAINKNLALVKALLEKGCDINKRREKDSSTVLYYAVKNADVEMVKLLLEYKPDLSMKYQENSGSYKANIIYACTSSKYHYKEETCGEVMKMLLDAGADPNSVIEETRDYGYTVTVNCCNEGSENLIELLIEYGGNPFKTYSSYVYQTQRSEIFSIVRKDLQNNSIYYERQNAVYKGLLKYYKNKTLVADDNLRLRSYAGRSGNTLTAIKKGTKVKVLDAEKMEIIDDIHSCWVKVEVLPGSVDSEGKKLANGTTGWCFLGYLLEEK